MLKRLKNVIPADLIEKISQDTSILKKLIVGFGTIIFLTIILFGLSFININNFEKSNQDNLHSFEVLKGLNDISEGMLRMETNQRGMF